MTQSTTPRYVPGMVVGHQGYRCEITHVFPSLERVDLRSIEGYRFMTIPVHELHEAPPLPEHVETAAREFAPFLANPYSIFDEGK